MTYWYSSVRNGESNMLHFFSRRRKRERDDRRELETQRILEGTTKLIDKGTQSLQKANRKLDEGTTELILSAMGGDKRER